MVYTVCRWYGNPATMVDDLGSGEPPKFASGVRFTDLPPAGDVGSNPAQAVISLIV